MNECERRIARARLLRRQGKTYNEIREQLDVDANDDVLQFWLRGIPRPQQTLRGRARDDLRRECRRLRAQGLTYNEIADVTGASKGSISPWVRDVKMPDESQRRHQRLSADARVRAGVTNRGRATARRELLRRAAATRLGAVTDRDLFVAGLSLYWAEGSKDKPWRRSGRVVLINSDPSVLLVFLAWLDLVGVSEEDRRYRLTIHESADAKSQEQWWAERLAIPLAAFGRATLKRHNPRTIRRNTGASYHGCLVVSVARSSRLYYAVEGWWQGLSDAVQRGVDGAHWSGNWSPVG